MGDNDYRFFFFFFLTETNFFKLSEPGVSVIKWGGGRLRLSATVLVA